MSYQEIKPLGNSCIKALEDERFKQSMKNMNLQGEMKMAEEIARKDPSITVINIIDETYDTLFLTIE